MFYILPGPCGPGPLHHHNCKSGGGGGGGGSGSGGGGGSSGGGSGGGGGGSSSSSGGGGGGSSSGGGGSSTSSVYSNDNTAEPAHGINVLDPSNMSFWLLLVALAAVGTAIIAMVAGQRKNQKPSHPLTGSVSRRMELFNTFAENALCGDKARPERVVEMTASHDDYSAAV
jgi:hypothetical protein